MMTAGTAGIEQSQQFQTSAFGQRIPHPARSNGLTAREFGLMNSVSAARFGVITGAVHGSALLVEPLRGYAAVAADALCRLPLHNFRREQVRTISCTSVIGEY